MNITLLQIAGVSGALAVVLVFLGIAIESTRGAGATPPYDSRGRLLVSRKLMLVGLIFLGIACLLAVSPDGLPSGSFGYSEWWQGAIFGFLLCYFIHLAAKVWRGLAATRKQAPKT